MIYGHVRSAVAASQKKMVCDFESFAPAFLVVLWQCVAGHGQHVADRSAHCRYAPCLVAEPSSLQAGDEYLLLDGARAVFLR